MTLIQNYGRLDAGAFVQTPRLPRPIITALEFPSNTLVEADTVRFALAGANWPGIQPVTILWHLFPFVQTFSGGGTGYNTTFFSGSITPGSGTGDLFASYYFGCHPYPENFGAGPNRNWEIAINQLDDIDDENANSTRVDGFEGRWYRQAATGRLVNTDELEVTFYWDIDAGFDHLIQHTTTNDYLGRSAPNNPGLVWGDAPWNPGAEMLNGRLRGMQVLQSVLDTSQIGILSACQFDSAALSAAANMSLTHWYLNLNPSVADVSDKSGSSHNPVWFNSNRPDDHEETI